MNKSIKVTLLIFLILTGASQESKAAKKTFSITSQTAIYNQCTGEVDFEIDFSTKPDFSTVDSALRPANSFQYFINQLTPDSPSSRPFSSLIRGDEIHFDNDIRVRDESPSDPAPESGGWGPVRGTVDYELKGKKLTFSIPLDILNVSGTFGYQLEAFEYGSSAGGAFQDIVEVVTDSTDCEHQK